VKKKLKASFIQKRDHTRRAAYRGGQYRPSSRFQINGTASAANSNKRASYRKQTARHAAFYDNGTYEHVVGDRKSKRPHPLGSGGAVRGPCKVIPHVVCSLCEISLLYTDTIVASQKIGSAEPRLIPGVGQRG